MARPTSIEYIILCLRSNLASWCPTVFWHTATCIGTNVEVVPIHTVKIYYIHSHLKSCPFILMVCCNLTHHPNPHTFKNHLIAILKIFTLRFYCTWTGTIRVEATYPTRFYSTQHSWQAFAMLPLHWSWVHRTRTLLPIHYTLRFGQLRPYCKDSSIHLWCHHHYPYRTGFPRVKVYCFNIHYVAN